MGRSPTSQLQRPSASRQSVSLLELEPDVGWLLDEDERDAAASIRLPVRTIDATDDFLAVCHETGAFGAILLDGVLVHEMRMGDHDGIRLLGPGDAVVADSGSEPLILSAARWASAGQVRVAFMEVGMLVALNRWPRLMVGLYRQLGQQVDRLATQLVICQLPRVEDRILTLMWLLAGSWGRVTSAGTRLPLELTHEALGKMIGARRPTVSLAVRELADRGAMLRQAEGWLLLEPPPLSQAPAVPDGAGVRLPSIPLSADRSPSGRTDESAAEMARLDTRESYTAVREAVRKLRQQHVSRVERFEARLQQLRRTRELCAQTRDHVARQRLSRRQPTPS